MKRTETGFDFEKALEAIQNGKPFSAKKVF